MRVSLGMFLTWLLLLGFVLHAFGTGGLLIAVIVGAVLTFL